MSIGASKPEVSVEKQNEELVVIASSKKGVDRIEYKWNEDGETQTINVNGQEYIEQNIELPVGSNTLKLVVYDINGKTAGYEKKYDVEAKAPQLALEGSSGKLKITAKDNEQMAYITYRWDDGDEGENRTNGKFISTNRNRNRYTKGTTHNNSSCSKQKEFNNRKNTRSKRGSKTYNHSSARCRKFEKLNIICFR